MTIIQETTGPCSEMVVIGKNPKPKSTHKDGAHMLVPISHMLTLMVMARLTCSVTITLEDIGLPFPEETVLSSTRHSVDKLDGARKRMDRGLNMLISTVMVRLT